MQPINIVINQDTLSTHPLNTPYQHTLSTPPLNTPSQHTLSRHPHTTLSQPTLSTHPLNTPSQHTLSSYTLSTHPLNKPSQHTLSTHPFNTPSQPPTLSIHDTPSPPTNITHSHNTRIPLITHTPHLTQCNRSYCNTSLQPPLAVPSEKPSAHVCECSPRWSIAAQSIGSLNGRKRLYEASRISS